MLFCGSDVARALGYTNPSKALTDHCKSDLTKRYPIIDTLGRSQEAIFIPESDLYRLVFRSKLPSAERFTDWVTTEVLPSIWKNGGYIAQQETLSPEELMVNGCNMTVHRDYANKACPGQYLYDRHGAIAAAVNELLGSGDDAFWPNISVYAGEENSTATLEGELRFCKNYLEDAGYGPLHCPRHYPGSELPQGPRHELRGQRPDRQGRLYHHRGAGRLGQAEKRRRLDLPRKPWLLHHPGRRSEAGRAGSC